jgi:hypothetical protein
MFGGVGSRRGRTNRHEIHSGDVLDFGVFYMLIKKKATSSIRNETTWTGVARIQNNHNTLYQAAFKPRGIWENYTGTLYYLFMDSF